MSKLAVVFGGSGFVGRHVVRELAKRGWRVRVGVRRPHLAMHLRPMGVVGQIQLAQVNIRHQGSIEQALNGADAVINCVGILFQQGSQKFAHVHSAGAANIARACAAKGIKNLVHLSAIGADSKSDSLYAQSKGEGEEAIRNLVPTTTILRPSVIFGTEDEFFNRFAAMARLSPALPLIGGGHTKFQPVYVDDVADAVCECLTRVESRGEVYELGGPSIYSFKQVLQLMLEEIGARRILLPVPFFAANAMGFMGEIIKYVPMIDPFLTRDQVRQLKNDNIVCEENDCKKIEALGIVPKSLEAILPSYMVRYRKYGQFSSKNEKASA